MRKPIILDGRLVDSVKQMSIYRVSDAPPDWAEKDPTQPDYIKNKPELVAGKNVRLTKSGNKIIISVVNNSDDPDIPDIPDVPDEPDTPDIPDVPSEEGSVIEKIIEEQISVYVENNGQEKLVPFAILQKETSYNDEGFYVFVSNETVTNAGYQVTFDSAETDIAQAIFILKEAVITNSYQYVPNLGQWFEKGFDGTYWIADGEVTKNVNDEEKVYIKYKFNSELWGDPIKTTEYWRFEMEV